MGVCPIHSAHKGVRFPVLGARPDLDGVVGVDLEVTEHGRLPDGRGQLLNGLAVEVRVPVLDL